MTGAVLFFGCRAGEVELAEVTGTVRMDGKPLEQALVRFIPQAKIGRPSSGVTDHAGRYHLLYTARDAGAVVGPAKVEITTGDPENPKMFPETVPAKYNVETTLEREVESGENVFDFEVESK